MEAVLEAKISLIPSVYVDLTRFSDQWDVSFLNQYSYNPCDGFTEGSCSSVAVCQITAGGGMFYPCGSQDSAAFINDPTSGLLTLTYSSTDGDGFTRTSNIVLKCTDEGSADTLDVNGEDPSQQGLYEFQLNSYHCCPKSGGGPNVEVTVTISVGSILVIVFFVLIVVYFIAGVSVQKFARKAQGKEIVPNVTFWAALPGLIKDGVMFTVKCGKTSPSYDSI